MRNSRKALAKDAADKVGVFVQAVNDAGRGAATSGQCSILGAIAVEATHDAFAAGATADDINRHQQ